MVRVSAAVLCLFGAAVLTWQFLRYMVVFPGPAVLGVTLELPPVLIGFAAFRLLRPVQPPPLIWSAAALVWGATAAAGCALLANKGLIGLWAKSAGVQFASSWAGALSAPLNEELLKLCGVVMIALAAPRLINGPPDGLIYGALTGLGFQVVENVIYGLNSIVLSGATSPGRAVLDSMLVRVVVTGLGSHWTMTAVAGTGVGYFVQRSRRGPGAPGSWRQGVLLAAACLATAMAMHLLFDAPAVPVELKVAVNLVIVAALYLWLRKAFLDRARELLAAQATAGMVSQSEAGSLLSRRRRRRALSRAHSQAEREGLAARQQQILTEIEREAA